MRTHTPPTFSPFSSSTVQCIPLGNCLRRNPGVKSLHSSEWRHLVSRNVGKASISLAVHCPYMFACTSSQIWIHSPKAHPCATPRCGTGHRLHPGPQDCFFFSSSRFTPSYINVSAPTFCRSSCKLLHSFSLIRWCPFFLFLKDSSPNKSTPRVSSGERAISFPPSTLSLRHFFSPTHPESIDMCVFLFHCVLPIREKESREKEKKKKQKQK